MNNNVEVTSPEKAPLPATDHHSGDGVDRIDFAFQDGRPVLQKRRSTIKFEDDGMPSAIRPRDRRRLTSPPPPYARRAGRRFRARGHRAATRQEEQEQGETAMDWPAVVNIGGGDQPVRMFSLAWYICYFVAVMTICRLYTWVISRQFPSEPDS